MVSVWFQGCYTHPSIMSTSYHFHNKCQHKFLVVQTITTAKGGGRMEPRINLAQPRLQNAEDFHPWELRPLCSGLPTTKFKEQKIRGWWCSHQRFICTSPASNFHRLSTAPCWPSRASVPSPTAFHFYPDPLIPIDESLLPLLFDFQEWQYPITQEMSRCIWI